MSNKLDIEEKIGQIDPQHLIFPFSPSNTYILEDDLFQSIKLNGIKRPITIKDNREVIIGKKRALIAQRLHLETIEVRVISSNLNFYEYELLNLFDNLTRERLFWSEKAILQARVHEILKENHFKHRLQDTADTLHCSIALLSENIMLAEAILFKPEIGQIQDRATALKYVGTNLKRKKQEQSLNPKENNILFGDVKAQLGNFNDKEFDLCIIYGDIEDFSTYIDIYRTLKNNSFIYIFSDKSEIQREALRAIGYSIQNYPLIWAKEDNLLKNSISWQYSKNYEFITVGVKGTPALLLDVVSSLNYSSKKGMIKRLLEVSSYEESNILHPFCCDSLVKEACEESRRSYTLICNNIDTFNSLKGNL